jgi:hypothetical protein
MKYVVQYYCNKMVVTIRQTIRDGDLGGVLVGPEELDEFLLLSDIV